MDDVIKQKYGKTLKNSASYNQKAMIVLNADLEKDKDLAHSVDFETRAKRIQSAHNQTKDKIKVGGDDLEQQPYVTQSWYFAASDEALDIEYMPVQGIAG